VINLSEVPNPVSVQAGPPDAVSQLQAMALRLQHPSLQQLLLHVAVELTEKQLDALQPPPRPAVWPSRQQSESPTASV